MFRASDGSPRLRGESNASMKHELDEETAATLRRIVREWHDALTEHLQRQLKAATGQDEVASINADIAKTNRQRDEVLAALGNGKGA